MRFQVVKHHCKALVYGNLIINKTITDGNTVITVFAYLPVAPDNGITLDAQVNIFAYATRFCGLVVVDIACFLVTPILDNVCGLARNTVVAL